MKHKNTICLWFLAVIILVFSDNVNCGRYSSKPSYSRPSTSYSRPSPSRPSPSSWKPSPSSWKPSPSSWKPSPSSWKPSPSKYTTSRSPTNSWPSHTSRPTGFDLSNRPGTPAGGNVGQTRPSNNFGFKGSPSSNIGFKPSVLGTDTVQKTSASNLGHSNSGSPSSGLGLKPSTGPAPSIGFKGAGSGINSHGTSSRPSGPAPSIGFKGTTSNTGFKPSAPQGPPIKPLGNVPKGVNQVTPPPYRPLGATQQQATQQYATQQHQSPTYNPAGYGSPPTHGYYPQQTYHPSGGYQVHAPAGGVTNIHINNVNTNNHHYGGGYGYGGSYFASYPSYHYSNYDTGGGHVGFFLGYSLGRMSTPTYHYHSAGFYDGYTPRYDHYEVHHYYHNKESIPAQSTIQPNTIIGCIGDSGSICPFGTTSLCTSNGAVLCVASAKNTVPCIDQTQGNCVKTVIPCVNGTSCKADNETVSLPCISKAQVPGNITYVNNTIIVQNTTIINNFNTTLANRTALSSSDNNTLVNSTVLSYSSNQTLTNSSLPLANLTYSALNTLANLTSNWTAEAPTTTTLPTTTDTSTAHEREKRDTPAVQMNDFCVTILALPAERKPTEKEKIVEKSVDMISKFLVKSLGLG